MKKLTSIILSTLGTALLFTHAHSASFDCEKAATWVEKTICESSELSNLDEAMANKYKQELANNSGYED
uniref:lysozyme inhibitor LprI family protein n=1 Tax=Psychrobacter sp. GW64-MNA-CIBAN-0177 TaxID=3140449 RepID=UPI00387E9933